MEKVVIKDSFERYGNTIVIDHGFGVVTLYCHLDSFGDINIGDRIEKGNRIGVMGKTGYATNDHLHWEMLVNNVAVDPMQWTKIIFSTYDYILAKSYHFFSSIIRNANSTIWFK